MNNVLDYLDWRGDLSFKVDPFNEVDALVLARLAYLDLEGLVDESFEEVAIQNVEQQYQASLSERFVHYPQDAELFHKVAHSKRFEDLKLARYINHLEPDTTKQFAAVTFIMSPRLAYLSFRGTDSTFTGWREDLDMTYAIKIPSQIEAVNYLNAAIAAKPLTKFYLGGHSKGGNLAIAALALQNNLKVQNKVRAIFSFDGPGFCKDIIVTNAYQATINKMTNYIPQSSIFGKMLGHEEMIEIVHSNEVGPYQHDIYSWEVITNHFNHEQSLTKSSHIIDQAFDDYLDSLTADKKAKIVAIIFEIVAASQVDTTRDFTKNFFKVAPSVIEKMADLEPDDKKILSEGITVLKNSFIEAAGEEWEKYAKELALETEHKLNQFVSDKYGHNDKPHKY